MPEITKRSLERLRAADAALASAEGLLLAEQCAGHGVSRRTVRRDLALLRDCGLGIKCGGDPDYRHRYTDGRRLFADWESPQRGDRWADAEIAVLGTATDAAVAKSLGRTTKSVERARRRLGIAAATPHRREWTELEIALLGKMSDAEVARRLGCSRDAVFNERRRRGIQAAGRA